MKRCGTKRSKPLSDESCNFIDHDTVEPPKKRLRTEISGKCSNNFSQQDIQEQMQECSDWFSDDMSMDDAISTDNDILLSLNTINILPIDINKIIVEYSVTYYYQCQECGHNSPFFNSNKQKYFQKKMRTQNTFYLCHECTGKQNCEENGYKLDMFDEIYMGIYYERFTVGESVQLGKTRFNNFYTCAQNDDGCFSMQLCSTSKFDVNYNNINKRSICTSNYNNDDNWFDIDSDDKFYDNSTKLPFIPNLSYNYNTKDKIEESREISTKSWPKPVKLGKEFATLTATMPVSKNEKDIKTFEHMLNNQCQLLIANNPKFDVDAKTLISYVTYTYTYI